MLPAVGHRREAHLDHVRARDRRLELQRRVERDELAVVDDRDPVAELVRLVHVVRREHHREVALAAEAIEHLPDRDARHGVEPGRRLVEDEDPRLVHEAARDLEPPPHAARERLHGLVGPLQQIDRREQVVDRALALLRREAVELREDRHVLPGREVQVRGHRLRDHADRLAHAVRVAHDVEAVHARMPGARHHERREHPDQRRLARAVRAEQAEHLAVLHVEVHLVDGAERAEVLAQVLDLDVEHGAVHHVS